MALSTAEWLRNTTMRRTLPTLRSSTPPLTEIAAPREVMGIAGVPTARTVVTPASITRPMPPRPEAAESAAAPAPPAAPKISARKAATGGYTAEDAAIQRAYESTIPTIPATPAVAAAPAPASTVSQRDLDYKNAVDDYVGGYTRLEREQRALDDYKDALTRLPDIAGKPWIRERALEALNLSRAAELQGFESRKQQTLDAFMKKYGVDVPAEADIKKEEVKGVSARDVAKIAGEAGIEQEKVRGGFDLRKQGIASAGQIEAANVRAEAQTKENVEEPDYNIMASSYKTLYENELDPVKKAKYGEVLQLIAKKATKQRTRFATQTPEE